MGSDEARYTTCMYVVLISDVYIYIYDCICRYVYTLHVLDHFLNVGCPTTIFYRQRPFFIDNDHFL